MCRYVFDAYRLDTTPGNHLSPFSPSLDWTGDDNAYLRWLREQFRSSPEFRQRLVIAVRAKSHKQKLDLSGPFSHVLHRAINNFGKPKQENL